MEQLRITKGSTVNRPICDQFDATHDILPADAQEPSRRKFVAFTTDLEAVISTFGVKVADQRHSSSAPNDRLIAVAIELCVPTASTTMSIPCPPADWVSFCKLTLGLWREKGFVRAREGVRHRAWFVPDRPRRPSHSHIGENGPVPRVRRSSPAPITAALLPCLISVILGRMHCDRYSFYQRGLLEGKKPQAGAVKQFGAGTEDIFRKCAVSGDSPPQRKLRAPDGLSQRFTSPVLQKLQVSTADGGIECDPVPPPQPC